MSVAERLRADEAAGLGSSTSAGAIDNILRLALGGVAAAAARPASLPAPREGDPDFSKAAELLDRATAAIGALTVRRNELEQLNAEQEKAFGEELHALQDEAAEWQRRAKVMKAQLHECENRLSEQQVRIETLTYRAEQAEARAAAAEQATADARKQSQLYHDKIVSTLGSLA